MSNPLIQAFNHLTPIPEMESKKLLGITKEKKIKKGELFIREGEIPTKLGFVEKGLFRYYYIDRKGNEFTKGFFPEYSFLASYSATLQNRGSYFSIEALEDSIIHVIDYPKWLLFFDDDPCWDKFLIKMLQKGYVKKENREREFLLHDAEERYIHFMEEYPGLDRRVKQHMIASYLGITSVALSRVRKKMGLVNIG